MMNLTYDIYMKKLLLLVCICFAVVGCKKKAVVIDPAKPVAELAPESDDHKWYYFTNDNFVQIHLPQVSKLQSLKPWTENLRVSSANADTNGNGFLLVNRLGILIFEGNEEPVLVHVVQLFGSSTAENLVFADNIPYFTLYRSTFFNKAIHESTMSDANRPYLVRVSQKNRMLYPALTYGDMKVDSSAEIVSSIFDGESWLAAIKTTNEERTTFAYKQWKPLLALDAMQLPQRTEKSRSALPRKKNFMPHTRPNNFRSHRNDSKIC